MDSALTKLVATMTSETYQTIAYASETGKWPDGSKLSTAQRAHCLQLVLLWQAEHNSHPQHMTLARGGELTVKTKQQLQQELGIDDSVIPLRLDKLAQTD
jgi:uncharacterized protein